MPAELARDVLIRHGDLLKTVKAESEQEAERVRAEIEKEGLEKQQRGREVDLMRERSKLTVQEERSRYYQYYRRRW